MRHWLIYSALARYNLRMLHPAEPAKQLRRYVRKYVHVESSLANSALFWPIPARSVTCIEFTFGEPYRIHHADGSRLETTFPSTLIGAKTYQRISLELRGHVETFAILFHPTGLQRLFSMPGAAIVNEHYEADMVLGPAMGHLRVRLGEAKSLVERVRIADAFLTTLIPRVENTQTVDAAVDAIVSSQGCVRIADLSRHAGLGLRQFERRFASYLGINPKFYARIVRFEAAIRNKTISPCYNWTRIAHELGYHDQMHMIHDFQLLCGESPTALAGHLEHLGSVSAQPQAPITTNADS
jgi:AraC-like DNA-binding protein